MSLSLKARACASAATGLGPEDSARFLELHDSYAEANLDPKAAAQRAAADLVAEITSEAADLTRLVADLLPDEAPAQAEPVKAGTPAPDALFSRAASQTDSPAFKRWSNDASLVPKAAAMTYAFKTGEKVVVEAFHGTQRPDRVGTVFKRQRATSGPMAFFTSAPDLASNYATGKQDTSLNNEDQNYANWFKYQPKGERSPVDIERAWYRLPREAQDKIAALAPRVMMQETPEGFYDIVLGPEDHKVGTGSYDYNLSETQRGYDKRGNPLKALVEDWLNSGNLFDDEERFTQVLKLAGVPTNDVTFDSPRSTFPFVYHAYVAMQKPLVTDDVPQSVRDALVQAAKRDRTRAQQGGDAWDKTNRTLRDWVATFNAPDNEHVWTSIPDKVTEVFKSLGYDGIIDMGGKGGGTTHRVYVPFVETQVKSAIGNKGKFDPTKNDIRASRTTQKPRGVAMQDAQAVIDAIRQDKPGAPTIIPLEDVNKSPDELLAKIRAAGAENDIEGAYHDGTIYVYPQHWASIERGIFVTAHHELRHHGFDAMFGNGRRKDLVLMSMYLSNENLRAAADKKIAGSGMSKVLATEEALADMPVAEMQALNGWDKIVAAVRQWLRTIAQKLGIKGPQEWTDNDIAALVQRAEDVSRGGGSGAMFSRQDNPTFYSALTRQAEKAGMNAAPASAWKQWLKGLPAKGVKPDEIAWSGIEEWLDLQQGKVTKQAVLDYLSQNGVKVTETVLGGDAQQQWEVAADAVNRGIRERLPEAELDRLRDIRDDLRDKAKEPAETKFATYQLPGGTNYREVLLTLPPAPRKPRFDVVNRKDKSIIHKAESREAAQAWIAEHQGMPAARGAEVAERASGQAAAPEYKSGHWDQPNIVAHVRLNDRTDSTGARVLFVEEIQSDFGAAVRKQKEAISKAVDSDFNGIIDRMKKAGVLEVACD